VPGTRVAGNHDHELYNYQVPSWLARATGSAPLLSRPGTSIPADPLVCQYFLTVRASNKAAHVMRIKIYFKFQLQAQEVGQAVGHCPRLSRPFVGRLRALCWQA